MTDSTNDKTSERILVLLFVKNYSKSSTLVEERKDNIEKFIVKNKKHINYRDKRGNTALFYAVTCNCPFIVDILIKNGADLNYQYCYSMETLIMIAMRNFYYDCVDLLIANEKINLDIQDKDGETIVIKTLKKCLYINTNNNKPMLSRLYKHNIVTTIEDYKKQLLVEIALSNLHYYGIVLLINNHGSLCLNNSMLDEILNILLEFFYIKSIYCEYSKYCEYDKYNVYIMCPNINIIYAIQILLEHGAKLHKHMRYSSDIKYIDKYLNEYIVLFELLFKYYSINDVFNYYLYNTIKNSDSKYFEQTQIFRFFIENGIP